jgi:TetR/AcrR family transcriptional regulator, regulator of cefoperazone and chloramphenicol sensitivity
MTASNTKERILESASRCFAQKGFRDTTVAEICTRADANIAAVNYHFSGKEQLYKAVWQYARELTRQAYPVPELAEVGAEEWLRNYIRRRVLAVLDSGPAGWFPKIVGREMMQPSLLQKELRDEFLRPGKQRLDEAIRHYLGGAATELAVHCATVNVMSLCAFLNSRRCVGDGVFCRDRLNPRQAEEVVEHITAFALGGLCGATMKRDDGNDDTKGETGTA